MTSRGQNTNYHQKYLFRVRLVRGESMYESPGKKSFWKKPGNKNIGKKSEFSEVLGKNVTLATGYPPKSANKDGTM